jgi:hypothetical protein
MMQEQLLNCSHRDFIRVATSHFLHNGMNFGLGELPRLANMFQKVLRFFQRNQAIVIFINGL